MCVKREREKIHSTQSLQSGRKQSWETNRAEGGPGGSELGRTYAVGWNESQQPTFPAAFPLVSHLEVHRVGSKLSAGLLGVNSVVRVAGLVWVPSCFCRVPVKPGEQPRPSGLLPRGSCAGKRRWDTCAHTVTLLSL